mgnify:CR=1 FL=1
MQILLRVFTFFFLLTNFSNADLIKPDITLKPLDLLTIQLNSLQNNDYPYKDAGIEQTWEFAHPDNKKMTGPLEKFKQMIYSRSYKILLEHENNEITILKETNNRSVYKVYILSKEKKKYHYIWQIEKVRQEGNLKNCWMTTNVSAPEYLGNII